MRVRIILSCDSEDDADLLARIRQCRAGTRSQQLKQWIYQGLHSEPLTVEQRLADLEERLRMVEARSSLPQSEPSRGASQWDESVMGDLLQDWQQKGDES